MASRGMKTVRYSAENEANPPAEERGGKESAALRSPLEALVKGLGMELVELGVFHRKARKGSPPLVKVNAVVYKPGRLGTDDCAQVHHAMLPSLEQLFAGCDISVEVSTPGINRLIKDNDELVLYKGRGVRLWRTDISDWSAGILDDAGEQGITIKRKEGSVHLDYAVIAKARLDPSQEEYVGH